MEWSWGVSALCEEVDGSIVFILFDGESEKNPFGVFKIYEYLLVEVDCVVEKLTISICVALVAVTSLDPTGSEAITVVGAFNYRVVGFEVELDSRGDVFQVSFGYGNVESWAESDISLFEDKAIFIGSPRFWEILFSYKVKFYIGLFRICVIGYLRVVSLDEQVLYIIWLRDFNDKESL